MLAAPAPSTRSSRALIATSRELCVGSRQRLTRSLHRLRPIRGASDYARSANFPDLSGLTILVVDDDYDSLELLAVYVSVCGGRPLPARTAYAALAYVDTAPQLDAMITDLKMPGIDGVELA